MNEYKNQKIEDTDLISSYYDKSRGIYANNDSKNVQADLEETLSLEYKLRKDDST